MFSYQEDGVRVEEVLGSKERNKKQTQIQSQHIISQVKQQRCLPFPPSPVDEECSFTPGNLFHPPMPELPNQPFLPPSLQQNPSQTPTQSFPPPPIHQHQSQPPPSQDYGDTYGEAEGMILAEPEDIQYIPYEPNPNGYENTIIPPSPPFYPSAREEQFLPSHQDTNGLQV